MSIYSLIKGLLGLLLISLLVTLVGFSNTVLSNNKNIKEKDGLQDTIQVLREGRRIFRYDTFGDEAFWGGQLRLHEAIAGEANGGVGPGVSPNTALALGLKVDIKAIPRELRKKIKQDEVDLDAPATTLALLKLNAVIGVSGNFDSHGRIESVGITCALCHSQVDNSFAPGMGRRLDGWANRDLNVGAIIAAAPDLSPFASLLGTDEATVRIVLNSWGPGKFDATLLLDGKAFRPDGKSAATLIPPAFGLAGINLHTWTGWGSVAHWNALVAVLEMGGRAGFMIPALTITVNFPLPQQMVSLTSVSTPSRIVSPANYRHYIYISFH